MSQIDALIDHQAELQAAVDGLAHELALLALSCVALALVVGLVAWQVYSRE